MDVLRVFQASGLVAILATASCSLLFPLESDPGTGGSSSSTGSAGGTGGSVSNAGAGGTGGESSSSMSASSSSTGGACNLDPGTDRDNCGECGRSCRETPGGVLVDCAANLCAPSPVGTWNPSVWAPVNIALRRINQRTEVVATQVRFTSNHGLSVTPAIANAATNSLTPVGAGERLADLLLSNDVPFTFLGTASEPDALYSGEPMMSQVGTPTILSAMDHVALVDYGGGTKLVARLSWAENDIRAFYVPPCSPSPCPAPIVLPPGEATTAPWMMADLVNTPTWSTMHQGGKVWRLADPNIAYDGGPLSSPAGLDVAGDEMFVADCGLQKIVKVNGTSLVSDDWLIDRPAYPFSIVVEEGASGYVYWSELSWPEFCRDRAPLPPVGATTTIWRARKDGSDMPLQIANQVGLVTDMDVIPSDDYLYYATFTGLYRVAK